MEDVICKAIAGVEAVNPEQPPVVDCKVRRADPLKFIAVHPLKISNGSIVRTFLIPT